MDENDENILSLLHIKSDTNFVCNKYFNIINFLNIVNDS